MAKIQEYINYIADSRARRSVRSLFNKFLNDDDPTTFKDIVFGNGTTPISVAGTFTTGISISGDGTTGISITDGFTGTTCLSITGTGSTGAIVVGASGSPAGDFVWYGTTASYAVTFDADGDTNGAVYIGADTKGLLFNLYGDTTGCGVFWNPSTDTNGTLSVGATGGSKGNDFICYGATNGNYLHWDQSADDLLLVGTATQLAVAGTTDASSSTTGSMRTAGGLGVAKALYVGTGLYMLNDQNLTIGTTTTNAETKITLEFDETTTGIGQFRMGDLSNAQVLNTNPGSTVVGGIINITHSAGAGDCDDLMGLYVKTHISGDGDSGLTSVPIGARAYVYDAAVDEVYGVQSHVRHRGTATVSGSIFASSNKLNLGTPSGAAGADDFTVTDNAGAGWFILTAEQSDVDVTGNLICMKVDIEGNVKGADAVMDINNGGASTTTILDVSGGTATYFMKFSGSTFVESGDITSGKSCTGGIRCYNNDGSAVGVIPFYED